MTPIQRNGTTSRYSDSVVHNGVIYLVEVPSSADGDITEQTRDLLGSMERQLIAAGSHPSRILMATIYLTDLADYDGMNAVWDAWLPAGSAPARACVQIAGLARAGLRIEIAMTAACP
ncbi:RidA family protein [Parazoarcus communis]|uniref:RidA family protein n=1 Tax=Parazoarcus communis SWub3 = DSM 12120 TaxID=1121029 RepID=A0A323V294_9RHOO|nr:RidA family protein [Parazoarcus communis]NMG72183.1 RidA family protein [Parazoarcus communis SWub3 = DSM 12120]PZA18190.1 RidA family protein [Azoarcus communis] [Parazoarcus communis SWub3 = DSM 12120]